MTLNNQSLANEVKCPLSACIHGVVSNPSSPGNRRRTSEASQSHGFNGGRQCHALPTKLQISVPSLAPSLLVLSFLHTFHTCPYLLSLLDLLASPCFCTPQKTSPKIAFEFLHDAL